MAEYLINNEHELFIMLSDNIQDNIPNNFVLSLRSEYTSNIADMTLDINPIKDILDEYNLSYNISKNIKPRPIKKLGGKAIVYDITFDISHIKTDLCNFIIKPVNWLRNNNDSLELHDIKLDDYTLKLDPEKQKKQIDEIKIKIKQIFDHDDDIYDIIFYEKEYVGTNIDSAPSWHIDNNYYSTTKINQSNYGITLTNPPNIEYGTMYMTVPILKIPNNFYDDIDIIKKQAFVGEKISKLHGIGSFCWKIGDKSMFKTFSFSKLFKQYIDKLTEDFLNKYHTRINPNFIKMAPPNVLHNIADILYHRSPDPKILKNKPPKFARGHIVFSIN